MLLYLSLGYCWVGWLTRNVAGNGRLEWFDMKEATNLMTSASLLIN